MNQRLDLFSSLKSLMTPVISMLVVLYFAYHALFGGAGLLAVPAYRAELAEYGARAAAVASERATLENQVALLKLDAMDPDYADELVRKRLGLLRQDEMVIPLVPERAQ